MTRHVIQSISPRASLVYTSHLETVVLRFSAVVVMEVTYGYDMKGGETFVSSVPRASDIVLSVGTPELFALCTTFPFGGFVVPCIPLIIFDIRMMQ